MYNLLMTAGEGYWNHGAGVIALARFLEYTADNLRPKYSPPTPEKLAELRKYPVLFAYELQTEAAARIGYFDELRLEQSDVAFTFQFDPLMPEIPASMFAELCFELGLRDNWEGNRSHWALKDVDLLAVLSKAGIVRAPQLSAPAMGAQPKHVSLQTIQPAAIPMLTPAPQIFLVHGHDDAVKHEVARFIERLGMEAVILHEKPNIGRTIINKFQEVAAHAAYAVVLMTPDDEGGKRGGGAHRRRARQNVVFELGFFIGHLGPKRVCALVAGDIEQPSDFDGVVYIPFAPGNEAWKLQLAREFQAVDIPGDWKKVL